jgi:hypothetical protein
MVPITPKHIARDLDIKESVVRAMLRERYGRAPNYRWTFDKREAKQVANWLAKALGKEARP